MLFVVLPINKSNKVKKRNNPSGLQKIKAGEADGNIKILRENKLMNWNT